MQYKTITLGLIEDRPELHEWLRGNRLLLTAVEAYAIVLRTIHEQWKGLVSQAKPGSDPSQVSSEALELATQELLDFLPSASPTNAGGPMTLDELMNFLRRHTPPAS